MGSVKWSETIVSCSGSVSQYVLCMTPLSSDGSSDEECVTTVETHHGLDYHLKHEVQPHHQS